MESCYVTFSEKADAEKAVEYMELAQVDGQSIRVQFTLRPNRQGSPRRNRGAGRKWRRSPPRNYNKRDSPPINSRKRNISRSNSQSPKRVKATEG